MRASPKCVDQAWLPAEGIGHHVSLSGVVVYAEVVILDQFQPPSLPEIEIWLGEDVLEALVVGVYLTPLSDEIVPPYLQGMHHGCQFQVMGGIIGFMRA